MQKRMNILVVEDDDTTCLAYQELCSCQEDIFLIGTSSHTDEAIKLTAEFQPNVVILDLELHKGSGSGLQYLQGIHSLNLKTRPYILVVTNNISPVTHAIARNSGADYVIVKTQADYSEQMVIDFLRSINTSLPESDSLRHSGNREVKQRIEEEYVRRLRQRINTELDMVGISPRATGRAYLAEAIEMLSQKRQTYICAEIAKKYKKTDASVERAMQNAINSAWRRSDIETLEQCYTAVVSSEKGVLSLMEFVYYYADKVKNSL